MLCALQERLDVELVSDLPSQPDIPTPRIPDGPPAPQDPSPPQEGNVVSDVFDVFGAPACFARCRFARSGATAESLPMLPETVAFHSFSASSTSRNPVWRLCWTRWASARQPSRAAVSQQSERRCARRILSACCRRMTTGGCA